MTLYICFFVNKISISETINDFWYLEPTFSKTSISAFKATEIGVLLFNVIFWLKKGEPQNVSTNTWNLCHKAGADAWFYAKEAHFVEQTRSLFNVPGSSL